MIWDHQVLLRPEATQNKIQGIIGVERYLLMGVSKISTGHSCGTSCESLESRNMEPGGQFIRCGKRNPLSQASSVSGTLFPIEVENSPEF